MHSLWRCHRLIIFTCPFVRQGVHVSFQFLAPAYRYVNIDWFPWRQIIYDTANVASVFVLSVFLLCLQLFLVSVIRMRFVSFVNWLLRHQNLCALLRIFHVHQYLPSLPTHFEHKSTCFVYRIMTKIFGHNKGGLKKMLHIVTYVLTSKHHLYCRQCSCAAYQLPHACMCASDPR